MDEGPRRLLAAIVCQAITDARQIANPALAAEARCWLATTGTLISQYLGFTVTGVTSWLGQLPSLPYQQLEFWNTTEEMPHETSR